LTTTGNWCNFCDTLTRLQRKPDNNCEKDLQMSKPSTISTGVRELSELEIDQVSGGINHYGAIAGGIFGGMSSYSFGRSELGLSGRRLGAFTMGGAAAGAAGGSGS
jgi:hypothetical protein